MPCLAATDDGDRDLEPLGSGRISWLRKESVGALQLAKQVRRAWRGKPEETTEVSATAQLVNMLVAAGVEPKADLAALLTSTESQAGTGRDPSDVPPPTILSELDLTAASGLDSKDHSAPVSMGDTHGTSFSDTALTSVDADETSGSEEESDAESEEESDSEGDSEEESETESESDYSDTTASEDSSEEDASDGEGGGKDAEDADETSVHDMILRMRRPARSGRAVKVKCEFELCMQLAHASHAPPHEPGIQRHRGLVRGRDSRAQKQGGRAGAPGEERNPLRS